MWNLSELKFAVFSPIGLFSFAVTTMLFCIGVMCKNPSPFVAVDTGVGVTAGGLLQILAGFAEFLNGNTLMSVLFVIFGIFWRSISVDLHRKDDVGFWVSLTVLGVGCGIVHLWSKTSIVTMLIIWLFVAFVLIGCFGCLDERGVSAYEYVFGIVGFVLSAIALYGSLAEMIALMGGKKILPLGECGPFIGK